MTPTPDFASLVYGPAGVGPDDPAEAFHEASRLYPRVTPLRLDVLADLSGGGELATTVARAGLLHDHRSSIELPAAIRLRGSLEDAVRRRRSRTPQPSRPLQLVELGTLLASAYARMTPRSLSRPVPSAGALYPLEVYVAALSVNGLTRGAYHFHPFRHRLARLGPLAWSDLQAALVDAAVLDHAAAVLIITATFWRSRFKYGQRGYRFALLEAGHVGQSLVLAAAELDLQALPLGGFYDRRLDAIVGADGLDEATVHAVVLGGQR